MKTYDFRTIEKKWQAVWAEQKTFRAPNPGDPDFDATLPKFYVLDMFPYPSGRGLHVGHPLGYIATDIIARYKRMAGFNVLHPMGYDSFGLPAEQYAVETGTHPRVTTDANIATYRRQLTALALSVDWDRELATTDPDYYRWTQWIFLQLFGSWFDTSLNKARPIEELRRALENDAMRIGEEGEQVHSGEPGFKTASSWGTLDERTRRELIDRMRLAFIDEVPVNWCPQLGTVLANEEVTNEGRSERGNFPVFRRPLRQWMLRITAYAERLLEDMDALHWPESLKLMQRNWIGRSEGARVRFRVVGMDTEIEVFTTRPDTLFGATYMVLAPEHPLVERVTTESARDAVGGYRAQAAAKSELDRQTDTKSKDGVFTGGYAVNPVNDAEIPIWIADYVLMGYGTGAIMAVPGHDERDFAFAKQNGLPIRAVVAPPAQWYQTERAEGRAPERDDLESVYLENPGEFVGVFSGNGMGVHSQNPDVSLDGLPTDEAKDLITKWLDGKGSGRFEVQYKLRDWLFSRQRYWGEPFPILHGPDGEIVGVDEADLPVELPPLEDFRPRGSDDPDAPPQPSLGRADDAWKTVVRNGRTYQRELNTMPQWAGSCWYYLRFADNTNSEAMIGREAERYWMKGGIDLYVGGVEHAVLHLLYARFWHKVLFDLGHVSTIEPFQRLFNQGYIQAFAYQDERGLYVEADAVVEEADGSFSVDGKPVTRSMGKMGKSLKNSVTPDELFESVGCDTFRLYEMYLGPIEQSKLWNTEAIVGVHRFLQRLWRNLVSEETGALLIDEKPATDELGRLLHRTIHDVTEDMEGFRFNTAIARLIELNNKLVSLESVPREVAEPLVLMVSPMAPHIAEELWERLGHTESLVREPWPVHDEAQLVEDTMEIVVQVLGKKRGTVRLPVGADEEAVREAALAEPGVQRHLEGKTIRKVIHVAGKLVNIVAS